MDLIDQNRLAEKLLDVLVGELGDVPLHLIMAVERKPGGGFAVSFGNLTDKSSFESWEITARPVV